MPIIAIASLACAGAASLIAASLSIGTLMSGIHHGYLPGCSARSACDAVIKSRWSRWIGFPVAGIGVIAYLTLFGFTLLLITFGTENVGSIVIVSVKCTALLVVLSATWFSGLQQFVLRRWCGYCLTIHLCGLIAALLVLRATPSAPNYGIPFILFTILVAGQLAFPSSSQRYVPAKPDESLASGIFTKESQSVVQASSVRTLTHRSIRLHGGRVVLNVDEWPILGLPTAKHVVAWLFDHTCPECHREHQLILELLDRFEGRLSVITIPVPMNPACNPAATCKDEGRIQACEYASLAWAVWLADPMRYALWDQFMAQGDHRQPYGLALEQARSCVSPQPLANLDGVAVQERLAAGIEVYRASQSEMLPCLLLPRGILKGRASTAGELYSVVLAHI